MEIIFKSEKYGLYQLVMDNKMNIEKLRKEMIEVENDIKKFIDYFDLEFDSDGGDGGWYISQVDGDGIVLSFDGDGGIFVFLDEDGESIGNCKYHWSDFEFDKVRKDTINHLQEWIEHRKKTINHFEMCIPEGD